MNETFEVLDSALGGARRPCVTSSFQADCMVLVHMLVQRCPDIPVLFIDTRHHFAETLAYRDRIATEWKLNLVNVTADDPAPGLWRESIDSCCARHKVGPLFKALEPYDTWFTALRREQSPSRSDLTAVGSFRLPSGSSIAKINPLVDWTMDDVMLYAQINGIPVLPLYDKGYASIGCEPCTQLPVDPTNPRSGRWQGRKLECGIHIEPGQS